MKAMILSLATSLLLAPLASAQQEPRYSEEKLSGRVDHSEFLVSPPTDLYQGSSSLDTSATTPQRRGTLRSVARGIARTIYHAGVISGSAALVAADALSSNYGTFVPASTYGVDSCVHGYTTAECPYGASGESYGSMYLSGRGTTRYRPDYMGGYRYYSSDGNYGTIRPSYSGGYRVTSVSTGTPYQSASLQSVRYGSGMASIRSPGW